MNLDQLSRFQFGDEAYKKFQLSVKDKRELVHLINESVFRKSAKTAQERYEVLDLRDKVIKLIRYDLLNQIGGGGSTTSDESGNTSSASSVNVIVSGGGACMDMCPEKERYSRDYLNLCGKYEMQYDPTSNDYQIDYGLMIKEYTRSSADQDLPLPNEMRPLDVLYDTMLYLIDQVITRIETERNEQPQQQFLEDGDEIKSDFNVCEWYDFIWNRTRSIRKDIIQQRLLLNEIPRDSGSLVSPVTGVLIIEQCARFHIMCSYRLSNESPEVFDFKINEENLKNCFQSLRQYYEATATSTTSSTASPTTSQQTTSSLPPSPNEAEFRAYIILLNLGESNILSEIRRWPKHVRYSPQVRFAMSMYSAYNSRNYVNFFRLIQSDSAGCDYLQACALHRHFYKMRIDAFKAIFTAFKTRERSFPLSKMCEMLGFDDHESVLDYCNMLDLEIVGDQQGGGDQQEQMIVMPGSDFTRFNLGQQDQAKLKGQRSGLLVQSKFYQKLNEMQAVSAEECLAMIVNGGETRPSRFLDVASSSLQSTSFDESGHFVSTEIQEFVQQANSILANLGTGGGGGVKTRAVAPTTRQPISTVGVKKPANAIVQKAKSLVKAAAQRQASLSGDKNEAESGTPAASIRTRKKSVSSNSSESSFKSVGKSVKPKTAAVGPLTNQQLNKPEESKKNLFSLIKSNVGFNNNKNVFGGGSIGTTTKQSGDKLPVQLPTSSTGLFTGQQSAFKSGPPPNVNPFSFIANKPSQPATTTFPSSTAFAQSTTSKPAVSAPNLFSSVIANSNKSSEQLPPPPSTTTSQNLFSSLLKKSQESASVVTPVPPTTLKSDQTDNKNKLIDQMCESTFQSIYLELMRDMCGDYLRTHASFASIILDSVLQQGVAEMVNRLVSDEVGSVKQQQRQADEAVRRKMAQLDHTANEIVDQMLDEMTSSLCVRMLSEMRGAEHYLQEELTNMVFQREFEIIIKQIANEINYEIRLDNLAENIYMRHPENSHDNTSSDMTKFVGNDESDLVIEVANLNSHKNSIFMNDLYSFLHECVHECTRLSLNVNRELYYEIKQALEMNQQFYLFRKWRLKSSSILLQKAYVKSQHHQRNSGSSTTAAATAQSHLISHLTKYSTFLQQNMDKFYKIYAFFIANESLNIIHSEHYQRHLAWHLSLNHRHLVLDLLMDNYFDIIRNDDDDDKEDNDNILFPAPSPHHQSTRVHLKLLLAMSTSEDDSVASSRPSTTEECWLVKKFFNTNDVTKLLEPNYHLMESFALDPLAPDEYSIKYCVKLFKTNSRPDSQYIKDLSASRSLYATNAIIFVLPNYSNINDDSLYMRETQQQFARLVRLIDSNINTCMFVSFMCDEKRTRQTVEYIINHTFTSAEQLQSLSYTYCQLDSNSMDYCVKNNGTLIHSYQKFLHSSFKSIRCHRPLTQVAISDLIYQSLFGYLDSFGVKRTYVPMATVVGEFNKRLRKLIEIVANPEYKKMAFPMPELVVDSDKWTLKYWNEDECLREVLADQVFDLMHLEIDKTRQNEEEEELDDEDQLEFDDLERMALGYFYSVLNKKLTTRCLRETRSGDSSSTSNESVISVFKLENQIRSNLEKLKNGTTEAIKMSQVNWSALILMPLVEFLITNGHVSFKNKSLQLDEFFIYHDPSQIKLHEWAYTLSLTRSRVKKRPPTTHDELAVVCCSSSPHAINSSVNKSKRKMMTVLNDDESSSQPSPRTLPSKKQNRRHKELNYHSYDQNAAAESRRAQLGQIDARLDEFFERLAHEKENTNKFSQYLREESSDEKTVDTSSDRHQTSSDKQQKEEDVGTSLELLLERLQEEKRRNERFNLKLNEMFTN